MVRLSASRRQDSAEGEPLLHSEAYYTLNEVVDGVWTIISFNFSSIPPANATPVSRTLVRDLPVEGGDQLRHCGSLTDQPADSLSGTLALGLVAEKSGILD